MNIWLLDVKGQALTTSPAIKISAVFFFTFHLQLHKVVTVLLAQDALLDSALRAFRRAHGLADVQIFFRIQLMCKRLRYLF